MLATWVFGCEAEGEVSDGDDLLALSVGVGARHDEFVGGWWVGLDVFVVWVCVEVVVGCVGEVVCL